MDAALRELNAQIDLATQRLLDDARVLTEDDLRGPSLLPGWTRAYVLAHLARGADALRSLLAGARSGPDRPGNGGAQPADAPARPAEAAARQVEAATRAAAGMRAAELAADLAGSAMALRAVATQLPDEAWLVPVQVAGLPPFPAAEVLTRRLTEVELHHSDLGTGYGPAHWAAAFTGLELPEPMRTQRQDRLSDPRYRAAAPPRPAARPAAAWQPGQRLPGSWIG